MSSVQMQFQSFTCDTCGVSATFEITRQGVAPKVFEDYPWLKTGRTITNTADGRNWYVCSDECDVKHTATGVRNMAEQKRIIADANPALVAQAAASAKAAETATAAIKAGAPAKVTL